MNVEVLASGAGLVAVANAGGTTFTIGSYLIPGNTLVSGGHHNLEAVLSGKLKNGSGAAKLWTGKVKLGPSGAIPMVTIYEGNMFSLANDLDLVLWRLDVLLTRHFGTPDTDDEARLIVKGGASAPVTSTVGQGDISNTAARFGIGGHNGTKFTTPNVGFDWTNDLTLEVELTVPAGTNQSYEKNIDRAFLV